MGNLKNREPFGGAPSQYPLRDGRKTAIALLLLLAGAALLHTWYYALEISSSMDFYQFRLVSATVAKSPTPVNIYSDEASGNLSQTLLDWLRSPEDPARAVAAESDRARPEIYSSPLLYVIFLPFTRGGYETAFRAFLILCLTSTAVGLLLCIRSFRIPLTPALAFSCLLLGWFEPLLSDIRVGNVNQLQFCILAVYVGLQRLRRRVPRLLLSGAILGLLLLFKPNIVFFPVLLALSLLLVGRFKDLALLGTGGFVTIAGGITAASVFFGSATIWIRWLEKLGSLSGLDLSLQSGNISFSRLLRDTIHSESGIAIAALLFASSTIVLWKRPHVMTEARYESERSFQESALLLGLGCLIYLMSADLVWIHYLILAVPSLLLLLRDEPVLPGLRVVPVLSLLFVLSLPLPFVWQHLVLRSVAVWVNLGVLFAIILHDLWRLPGSFAAVRSERDRDDLGQGFKRQQDKK